MQGFNEHLNEKKMCGEEDDKDLPFTPDTKKIKPSTAGKYGSAYSTVRNLARQAMQKQAKKKVDEECGKITVDEENIPVQHVTDSVSKVLGNKSAVNFITHLKPGSVKHTSWNKVNDALTKQGVKTQHIAKIAAHVKPAQFKEEVELQEASDSHKVMVTVSDPNHTAVSQRKEQIMKHVIVRAGDKGEAQAKAEAFYKKKGYKVHGSEYHSKQPATSMKTEELKGDQHKLDVDKDGTIEKSDLEKLRSKKTKNEELEMKTFSQFVEEIQEIEEAKKDDYWDFKDLKDKEKSQPTSRKIAGKAYGGAAQKDDEDDEDDKKTAKPTEKRGRGRPAGSKSGARQSGAAKKSYGGLTFHSLNLPNSNK